MKKRHQSIDKIDTGKWLITYSDLMNNLLVLFIALYAMSVIDIDKYKQFVSSFSENFGGKKIEQVDTSYTGDYALTELTTSEPQTEPPPEEPPGPDEFDELYAKIRRILQNRGYGDDIQVDKIGDYIYFRFTEGVFFYPDLPIIKEASYPVIKTIGEILKESDDLIGLIDIGGHTAKITSGPQSTTNFFAWELSSNRALTVLKFLVQECELPQSKMSITGYSCYKPYVNGNSEEYWAKNRRVEIRISKVTK